MEHPFTVEVPVPLPAERRGEHWWLTTAGREVRLSNLGKVFFPRSGYTKGDLLAYYWNVAPLLLPYLAHRPLVLKRMPEGAEGGHFIEKDAPPWAPDWLPRCHIPNFLGDEEANDFPVVEDEAGLLFLVNAGCIDLHPLHSRCDRPSAPDHLLFDLDPFEPATFDDVRAVALHVRAALEALGLPAYAKTTGATGMHVHVPIRREVDFASLREFAGRIAAAIRRADPDRVTLEWAVSRRGGKVFIDHKMNRRGMNAVAPWCVRPERAATVSVPVRWEEVESGFRPRDFTIESVHARIRSCGDPFRGVLSDPVPIAAAMERMGVRPRAPDEEHPELRWLGPVDTVGTPSPAPTSIGGS